MANSKAKLKSNSPVASLNMTSRNGMQAWGIFPRIFIVGTGRVSRSGRSTRERDSQLSLKRTLHEPKSCEERFGEEEETAWKLDFCLSVHHQLGKVI